MLSNDSAGNLNFGLNQLHHETLLPTLVLWSYLVAVTGVGSVANITLVSHLSRARVLPLVLQLALTDLATLMFIGPYEIIVQDSPTGVWLYPSGYCRTFLGLEVLLGTASIYLLILINFSALSKQQINVTVPILIVWLLAASLSVPNFTLANVIVIKPGYQVCSLSRPASLLVSLFRACLPVVLLFVGSIFTARRLCEEVVNPSFTPPFFRLAFTLSITHAIFSVHRYVFAVLYGIQAPLTGPNAFRTPPIANVANSPTATLLFAMFHYSISALRPFICWFACPEIRKPEPAKAKRSTRPV